MKARKECKKYRQMMMEAIDNEISKESGVVLNNHTTGCSECRNYYSEMQKYEKVMHSLRVETPYYIESKIMANIKGTGKTGLRLLPVFNYAVAFAAIIIIAVFITQIPLNNTNEKITFAEKKVENKAVTVANNKKMKPIVQASVKETAKPEIKQEIQNKVVTEKKEAQVLATNNAGGDNIAINSQGVNKPAQQAYPVNQLQAGVSSANSKVVSAADTNGKPSGGCPYGCLLEQQKAIVGNNVINPSRNEAAIIRIEVDDTSLVRVIIYDRAMRQVALLMDQQEVSGYYEADWYGKNDSGATVANDVYFVYMQIGTRVVKGYIVVKR